MNKKEKILLAALELFATQGYTETSIDSIAKHAKVSKGLTYTHFKNKDELLVKTIESTISKITTEIIEVDKLTFESFFAGFFDSLTENRQIIRLCLLLIVHPQTPLKVMALLEKQKQELLELLSFLLKDTSQNTSLEATLLLATIDGITLSYTTDANSMNLKEVHQHLVKKYQEL